MKLSQETKDLFIAKIRDLSDDMSDGELLDIFFDQAELETYINVVQKLRSFRESGLLDLS